MTKPFNQSHFYYKVGLRQYPGTPSISERPRKEEITLDWALFDRKMVNMPDNKYLTQRRLAHAS